MTKPRERPILFTGEMVRAILDGTKTQTRRVVKVAGLDFIAGLGDDRLDPRNWGYDDENGDWWTLMPGKDSRGIRCPYGVPGDLLYVRETWALPEAQTRFLAKIWAETYGAVWYQADDPMGTKMHHGPMRSLHRESRWRPSIHMPKRFARIWLRVTDVRVERVQEISEEDALAEGVAECFYVGEGLARQRFRDLWNRINRRRGFGWDTNPWVWVVNFERVDR